MRLRDRFSIAFGGAALVTAVLAVGGALRWTQAIVAGLIALALGTQILARRQLGRISPLVVILALAAVLTAIQLIPLPESVASALNSTGNELRANGAALSNTHPWRCISLDPAETVRALAFFVVLLGVALLALRFAAAERGRFALLGAVAVVCGLAAIVTGVHTLIHADLLYGVYEPRQFAETPTVFGPLLNVNHLGGLMAIGTILAFGLALYHRQPTQLRVLWIMIGLGCVVVCGATQSRGAILGLAFGGIVVAGITLSRRASTRTRHAHRVKTDFRVVLVIVVGLAACLYASAGGVVNQLNKTSMVELNQPSSKYAAWKSSTKLIHEAPVFGIGRGAVEATLTRVFPGSAYFSYSHLENEYLSVVVDWGVVGAVLIALAFGWCILTAIRRWRDGPLSTAALGALVAIGFQSVVDFGIEMMGVAIPVVVIAATVQLVPLRATDSSAFVLRIRRFLIVAAIACAAFILTNDISRTLQEDHDEIAKTATPTRAQLQAVVERHPMDYVAFGELATISYGVNTPEAIDFLNHAMQLHPTHLGLHRLAARMLVGVHRYEQAALEYSLSLSADPTPLTQITEILGALPTAEDIALAIPDDYPTSDLILHALHDRQRDDIAIKWLQRVVHRPVHDTRMIDTLYDMAMDRKEYSVAEETANLRYDTAHTMHARLMQAKARFQLKKYDELETFLADVSSWNGPSNEKAEAWFILCDVHIEHRNWDAALQCIHRLDASGLLTNGRDEVTKRLATITEERTHDSKMEQVEAMKRQLGLPETKQGASKDMFSGEMPKVTPTTSSGTPLPTAPPPLSVSPLAPKPTTLGIPNPFAKKP